MDNTTKIIIADENAQMRRSMCDGLRRAGFGAIYEASNGEEALAFSRMRYSDPTGDVGRQQRQRQVMNAVVSEALSPAVLINPVKQYRLSEAAANALTVGQDTNLFNVATLMMAMRKATADGLVGMPPISSVNEMNEAGAVMLWDEAAGPTFFENMKNGTLTQEDFVLPQ